jgi:hypothetical protein
VGVAVGTAVVLVLVQHLVRVVPILLVPGILAAAEARIQVVVPRNPGVQLDRAQAKRIPPEGIGNSAEVRGSWAAGSSVEDRVADAEQEVRR